MSHVVVVVGTDTGVGKTWVTAGLAKAAATRGMRVVAVKPIETGCTTATPADEEDGPTLARASAQSAPRAALVRLPAPVAPPEAADRAGLTLDFPKVIEEIRAAIAGSEVAFVEGAGGLLSPFTWETTIADVARELGALVLLVASDRLGTVSQTRLVVEALTARHLPVLGVVLTAPAEADASTGANAKAIARLTSVRVVEVPRTNDEDERVEALRDVADWALTP